MKKLIKEDYSFRITVISGKTDKDSIIDCRNGHEVGDTYTCEYGCPGGFCSKSMFKLFPLMEAVRAGGDLRNLVAGADKHSCEFTCPDGVVRFRRRKRMNENSLPSWYTGNNVEEDRVIFEYAA